MTTTSAAVQFRPAVELAEAMDQINAAKSFEAFAVANDRAQKLGLRLRGGFYIQKRSISPRTIEMVASAQNERELKEILQDIHYDELMR